MSVFPLIFVTSMAFSFWLRKRDLRLAAVRSYVVVFFAIAVSTEILSIFHAVTRMGVSIVWLALTLFSIGFASWRWRIFRPADAVTRTQWRLSGRAAHEYVIALFIVVVLLVSLLVALLSPPNNWDSMTYHMARVAEWIQHGSVDFYPTSIARQNHSAPLAEFAILHLQILACADVYANLVQWSSLLIAVLLATLVAKEFRCNVEGQLFSGLFAATIPMAILQSSSTQNDLVVGVLCLSFAFFLLRFVRDAACEDAFFAAMSFGLALLAKGTAYLYCAAIALAIGVVPLLSRTTWRERWRFLASFTAILVFALLVNAGHFTRNRALYGKVLVSDPIVTNAERSVHVLALNAVRNAALHLMTPLDGLDRAIERGVGSLLGEELNDPKSTYPGSVFSVSFSRHEDLAGNPLHFLAIASVLAALVFLKTPEKRSVLGWGVALILSAFFVCWFLRWQPWGSRLHTAWFLLGAPLVATAMEGLPRWRKGILICLALIFFLYSLPFLVTNTSRPLVTRRRTSILESDRLSCYFTNRWVLHDDYIGAMRVVLAEGDKTVGLCLVDDDWEYPLWVLTGRHVSRGVPCFVHVGVTDVSRVLRESGDQEPTLVITTRPTAEASAALGGRWIALFDSTAIRVLRRIDSSHSPRPMHEHDPTGIAPTSRRQR